MIKLKICHSAFVLAVYLNRFRKTQKTYIRHRDTGTDDHFVVVFVCFCLLLENFFSTRINSRLKQLSRRALLDTFETRLCETESGNLLQSYYVPEIAVREIIIHLARTNDRRKYVPCILIRVVTVYERGIFVHLSSLSSERSKGRNGSQL